MSSLQSMEKEEDAAWMLRDLTRVLLQPLDPLVLPSVQPKLQLVLIMQPEGRKEEEKMMEEP